MASDWQPIETAPKDGTSIDLWAAGNRYVDCRWVAGDRRHPADGWYSPEFNYGDGDFFGDDEQPSHWMPMPLAPDALRSQDKGEG